MGFTHGVGWNQGRARDERSRANAFAEGRAEWNTIATLVETEIKKKTLVAYGIVLGI